MVTNSILKHFGFHILTSMTYNIITINIKKRHTINCQRLVLHSTYLILLNLVFLAIVRNVSLVPSGYYLTRHLFAIKLGSANVDLASIFIHSHYDRVMRKLLSRS